MNQRGAIHPMNVIIPMAGMGKRLRPHTLTTPKPLLPIAGKPIVQRLVEDIVAVSHQGVNEIAFIVGRFGDAVENQLIQIAESLGARGTIHYQDEPLGTAHAILCAEKALQGPVTVAFADTLFRADFELDPTCDGMLWVKKIEDPRQFGVVVLDENGAIVQFEEKPVEFVSDLAMIGIYYFKDGEWLKRELQYLIDHHITNGGEYQLPDALRHMVSQGAHFRPGQVLDWMDCGNKDAMVETNAKILSYLSIRNEERADTIIENSTIHEPCYIGPGVTIRESQIGPGASIGSGAFITGSLIANSIVLDNAKIQQSEISNSMVGVSAQISAFKGELSLGDYSVIHSTE